MLKYLANLPIRNKEFQILCTSIPAGFPSPAADYLEDKIDLNELLISNPSATFFVKVEGDSMINAFIPDKALLVVDRSLNAGSGDIVVAVINGEFTVKWLMITYDGTFLTPANPKYKPTRINEEINFQVWGVVTKVITDTKDL